MVDEVDPSLYATYMTMGPTIKARGQCTWKYVDTIAFIDYKHPFHLYNIIYTVYINF